MTEFAELKWQEFNLAFKKLTIFKNLGEKDGVMALFEQFVETVLINKGEKEVIFDLYHRLLEKILEHSLETPFPATGNLWQDYLLDKILLMEGEFVFQLADKGVKELKTPLLKAAERDLLGLQKLFSLGTGRMTELLKEMLGEDAFNQLKAHWQLDLWGENSLKSDSNTPKLDYITNLKGKFYDKAPWNEHLELLANHYRDFGIGDFGLYHAFRFQEKGTDGFLKPIPSPDPIKLENLVGYERQREQILLNTTQFIQGFPGNNLLLYGDRGTGKSSTIKALVHEFGQQGLRMIEMTKLDLKNLPFVLDNIRNRKHRFIIFIDDLSFEEGEDDYKHLKAVLEGSLEARPENVLIYASSNRRHLIKERFSDREWVGDEEVRAQDTLQEKLSLGDRFGMTITFTTPDQDQYLEIVEGLAEQAGLTMEVELLREKALKWALWHNGRSGRTARQFIDDLIGRMGLEYE